MPNNVNLDENLYRKLENDINYAANVIYFENYSDKNDFKQDCWLDIMVFFKKHGKISRLSANFLIKTRSVEFFKRKRFEVINEDLFNQDENDCDIMQELIDAEDKKALLEKIEIIENMLGDTKEDIDIVNPEKNLLLKKMDFKTYRRIRNKYEYHEIKFIKSIKKYLQHHQKIAGS